MNRISGRLRIIFTSFFLLVLVSAGGTVSGLRAQSSDALAINLAGRQRMLIQWMTRLAEIPDRSPEERADLAAAISAFEQTLQAFTNGGQVKYPTDQPVNVPAAVDPDIQAQLKRLSSYWQNYHEQISIVQTSAPSDSIHPVAQIAVNTIAPALMLEADRLVRLYQEQANRRIVILTWTQVGFFISASLLLLTGMWVVARSILQPLRSLEAAARRIGAGDLNTPVQTTGPQEIKALAAAVDLMRLDLQISRSELISWNHVLETRVSERTRELDALYDVSREIASRQEPNIVFQSVTDKARLLLNADSAHLCLLEEDEKSIGLRSLSGLEEMPLKRRADPENEFIHSILADRCAHHCKLSGKEATCGMIKDRFHRSHLAASLWSENRIIGALCVGSQSEVGFAPEADRLLTRLAGAAALAIENARLYHQVERLAALEERQRIAANMHDGLAQTIDALGLLVDQADNQLKTGAVVQAGRTLCLAYERIRRASAEVRQMIAGLQDEPLENTTLQERLRRMLDRLCSESDPLVGWVADLPGALHLCESDASQVIGFAQEALSNARRHSGASRICTSLVVHDDQAELRIEDNGCGFELQRLPDDGRQHFGLKILQARAARLGGRSEIASTLSRGSEVVLIWPIHRNWQLGSFYSLDESTDSFADCDEESSNGKNTDPSSR